MPSLYQKLLIECNSVLLQEDHFTLPDEMVLQSLWFAGGLGNTFETTEGRAVKITQFGFWNKSAGPDFLHCGIELDGVSLTGDIELDHSAKHWSLHEHHLNPCFENVILHVSFEKEEQTTFIKTEKNKNIVRVIIPEELLQPSVNQLRNDNNASAHPGRCATPLENASLTQIDKLLSSAAKYRLQQKAKRFNNLTNTHGKDQALWVAIGETLGYKKNTFTFHSLCQRIPIKDLKKHSEQEILSILFGACGFLHPKIHEQAAHDSKQWLESLWETWWQLRQNYEFSDQKQLKWDFSSIRPVNHPQRRLAALAKIAYQWDKIRQYSDQKELKKNLTSLNDPFWNHHYTLTSKPSPRNLALIGASRVDELFANHLLPVSISYAKEIAWQEYTALKAPAVSEKVNRAAIRLFGKRKDQSGLLNKAWQHQALLQIYQDFCLEHLSGCENCPFPEKLKQWAEQSDDYYMS
ncbi:DUF2851 family protein [Akkermansiaceae bacterium]|nr:DUF2851 family protein [Akkermansiaceae bacterium]